MRLRNLRFDKDIMVGATLPQPVLTVTLVVDMEFYKMMGLRVPSVKKATPVSMKLTADSTRGHRSLHVMRIGCHCLV